MTFEGHNIKIIHPSDPFIGPRYTEPIKVEEEGKEINEFYKMIVTKGTSHK